MQIKLYWNTVTAICLTSSLWLLLTYSGRVESLLQRPDSLQSLKYLLWHFMDALPTPVLALRGFGELRPGYHTCAKNMLEANRVKITLRRGRREEGNTILILEC